MNLVAEILKSIDRISEIKDRSLGVTLLLEVEAGLVGRGGV